MPKSIEGISEQPPEEPAAIEKAQVEMESPGPSLREYKEWAKQRALAYVEEGNLSDAVRSVVSDLNKDERILDGQKQLVAETGAALLRKGTALTREEVLDWIEGF